MTFWAMKDNERIRAAPNIKDAKCEICNETLIPKCGQIKIWHFAHKSGNECDDWYEPESEWHINWKNNFPKEYQEVIMRWVDDGYDDIIHRADVKINNFILEFQHSPISAEQIEEREYFYSRFGNLIWILHKKFASGIELRKKGRIYTFRWKHPPESWWIATKPIIIDLGNKLFLIRKIYHSYPCGGWGEIVNKQEFVNTNFGGLCG